MGLKELLEKGDLESRKPSRREIADLLKVVDRDLRDAAVKGLSPDRKFSTAYEAALSLALVVLRAAGYRPKGAAHHRTAIAALPHVLGESALSRADYLETCRRKRNKATYDRAGEITAAQAGELIADAGLFRMEVLEWLTKNHPSLVPGGRT